MIITSVCSHTIIIIMIVNYNNCKLNTEADMYHCIMFAFVVFLTRICIEATEKLSN